MALISRVVGSTSNIITVFVQNSSVATGAGLTGLVYNTSGLTCYYKRNKGTASVQVTLADISTLGTFASGGFKVVDGTNMPGEYEFHPPDAAFASGADSVSFILMGAANMAPCRVFIELTASNNQDGVRLGLTSLPNAAAAASGGLPTVGVTIPNATAGASGGLLISGTNSGTTTLGALTVTGATTLTGNVTHSGTTTFVGAVAAQAGVAITNSSTNGAGLSITGNGTAAGITATGGGTSGVGILATGGATNGAAVSFVGTGSGNGFSIAAGATGKGVAITTTAGDGLSILPTAGNAIVATANGTSMHGMVLTGGTAGTSDGLKCVAGTGGVDIRGNQTGNVTGNLSGSVGSVTGAVGSVTGAVGSVTGAVGSVTGAVGSVTAAVTVTGTPAVNVTTWNGTAVAAPNVAGYPLVDVGKWIGGTIPAVNVTGVPKVDVLDWLGTTVTAGAIPAAAAGGSGGLMISGTNAGTTTLGALTVTGATTLTGNVTHSGTTTFVGAVAAQAGVAITNSATNGAGLSITGNGTAAGITATGGGTSGIGILATGGATNGAAVSFVGTGSGNGFSIAAGATGKGVAITTTAGDGLSILPTGGNAIVATANGTSMHGMVLTGGTAGTSDGLKCVAGTGGVDIRGNTTGSITGNLSGSVGSVTGAVGSVTGTVGSVTGSVGSVTGAVGSVTGGVTVTTNNDKTGYSLSVAPPTSSQIATAVWQDATAGDFTTASSVGKLLFTDGVKVSSGTGAGQISLSSGLVTVGTNNDKTGYTASTVSDKTGYALSSAGLDSVVIESGTNARQALSLCSAALTGVVSGAATTTVTIAGMGVVTTRIVATVDSNGNRSALTLTPPA